MKKVFARLRKAVLPAGVSIDLQEEVREVQQLSEKVESAAPPADRKRTPGIPQTKANARMIQLGLRPSPSGLDLSYYREIAERDPILALAGLRSELETWFRNVAQGFKVGTRPYDSMNRALAPPSRRECCDSRPSQVGPTSPKLLQSSDSRWRGIKGTSVQCN
jgi:hypothetical protein